MTRVVSVITATYAPIADYFVDTSLSVAGQSSPAGWEIEWIVQEDGESPRLRGIVDTVPFGRYGANNARLGIPATRNLALARAVGEIVQILDHDDIILPSALARMVTHFDDPSIHWAIGQADDLHPDGSRHKFTSALPFGRIHAGSPGAWAMANAGNWPIHCAGLLMRTDALRAIGGWAGLPVDDDVAMFSALSELVDGINDPTTTWLYRLHQRQTHKSTEWQERGSEGRHIALQRINAIRQLRGDRTSDAPSGDRTRAALRGSGDRGRGYQVLGGLADDAERRSAPQPSRQRQETTSRHDATETSSRYQHTFRPAKDAGLVTARKARSSDTSNLDTEKTRRKR